MDNLQELKRQRGIIARNIVATIQLPASDGLPVYPESDFEKAVNDGLIDVFEVEKVSQFARNLEKAKADANGDTALLEEIEKAQKDLSKLVKVKKQDKNGRMMTYYVRATSKEGSNLRKQAKEEGNMHDTGLSGVHVPKKMEHKHLGSLEHSRDEEGEGGDHKHYYKDKEGHEVHFSSGTLLEHGMAAHQDQSAEKDGEASKKEEEPDYHSLGRIVSHDFEHTKKHLGDKYVSKDGKKIDQHAILADHPGEKLKEAADKLDEAKKTGDSEDKRTPEQLRGYYSDIMNRRTTANKDAADSKLEATDKRHIELTGKSIADHMDGESKKSRQSEKNKKRNDAVRNMSGDQYSDELIESLYDSYKQSSGGTELEQELNAYSSMIGDAGSQSREAQQIMSAVEDICGEFKPHTFHKELDEQGAKDIIWGLLMNKLGKTK